ncbi:MAG: hypothetical protein KA369_18250 [Spirochaetes bacterium]|nr:hypothetical protein [Spirochaetota bacterium]
MDEMPKIIEAIKKSLPTLSHTGKVELYNNTVPLLKKAIEAGIRDDIIKCANTCLCCLEAVILDHTLSEVFETMMSEAVKAMKENEKWQDAALRLLKKRYPDLNPNSDIEGQRELDIAIPCIEDYGDYCAFTGLAAQLNSLNDIVSYYNDLSYYKNAVDNMIEVLEAGMQIRKFLEKNPGFPQDELRDEFKIDNTVINKLCQKMEKYKIIKREKTGNTFALTVLAGLR